LINLNTDRAVIAVYPQWSGGKFLLNCLGLSDHAHLQSALLSTLQLRGEFTPWHKYEYLVKKLRAELYVWKDLDLGDYQMFGDPVNPNRFYQVLQDITNGNKRFFAVAHSVAELKTLSELWPQATIISFRNVKPFIDWRRQDAQDQRWVNNELGLVSECVTLLATRRVLEWNTENYLDWPKFDHDLRTLYSELELPDYSEDLIQNFYQEYLSALERIRPYNAIDFALTKEMEAQNYNPAKQCTI
jgi:hypothetical protein